MAANSGISTAFQPDLAESAAAVETAMAQAMSGVGAYQAEAHQFIVEYGAEVVGGQTQVGHPGTPGGAGDIGQGGDYGGAGQDTT